MGGDTTVLPIFARHETFHPRFGWLKKGFDKVQGENNSMFSCPSAPVVLGVGKNMVKAIRYWCIAFKVIDETKQDGKIVHRRTKFAEKLLGEGGWDPFLENPSSLWLLHWNLFKPPCYAPAWYHVFSGLNKNDFSADDLLYSLKEFKAQTFPTNKVSDSSLKKDVNCVLRMYVEKTHLASLKEDSLECPFTELGIINSYTDSKRYTFNFGNKPNLPAEIVAATCLEFAASFEDEARTISLSRLLYDSGSPGQIFKLTESALSEAIETVAKGNKGTYLTETAGIIQFAYDRDPMVLSKNIIEKFYIKEN